MKGRAYRCAVCRKEDYRGRIVRHYLREHVPEKNIPYRCKLCRYVSEDRIQWDKHLTLKEHSEALKDSNIDAEVKPRSFLIEAREKFDLKVSACMDEKACIYELDKKTSEKVWKEKQKTCAADKENSLKDSKKNPRKRSAREKKDSTKKAESVMTVESRSNRDLRTSSGVSEEGMEAALEVIRSKVKQGKEDVLREIQLLLWTEKDGKELKQAEQSITQNEDCSEKETGLEKETETQRKEEAVKECARLKDAVKGQSNNVKAECTKVGRWKEEEDTEMVEGQFDDAESEESEADASSCEESSSSEDESEDCESVVENDAVEKKDIVDLTQESKSHTNSTPSEFELKRPTKIQEVIELDGDERSKEGNLEKICTEESGKQTTKRKREDSNDVPMKRKKGGDSDGAVKRKRDACDDESTSKRMKGGDNEEGIRRKKEDKGDVATSSNQLSDEEVFGSIEPVDEEEYNSFLNSDSTPGDLGTLGKHQDCVKAITPAVGSIVRECISAVSSAITAKVANQPLPLGAIMQGVANELAATNQNLSTLIGKMNDLCQDKNETRSVGVELRSIARNIDSMRTDVAHSAGAFERAAGDISRSLREFNTSSLQIKTALQSLTNQMSSGNDLLCKALQNQTKEYRRLTNTITGLHEDLRQGGTTCNLTRQILGIPTQPEKPAEGKGTAKSDNRSSVETSTHKETSSSPRVYGTYHTSRRDSSRGYSQDTKSFKQWNRGYSRY